MEKYHSSPTDGRVESRDVIANRLDEADFSGLQETIDFTWAWGSRKKSDIGRVIRDSFVMVSAVLSIDEG